MPTKSDSPPLDWEPGRSWSDGEGCPMMVDLPLGTYFMGESKDDKFATDLERPRRRVEVAQPLAFGRAPVTSGEYLRSRGEIAPVDELGLPVVNISWDEAADYCAWLSDASGRTYSLPCETEWEYACRAGCGHAFSCGEGITPAEANYWYDEDGSKVGPGCRTPSGTYPANAFGLHDMSGNVCEWMADTWAATLTPGAAGLAADLRVIRGGAWDYLPRLLRCSWRDGLHRASRRDNVGFRLVYRYGGES